ncbi:MAG: carbohydrate ABC transporter permease [Acidimicrobiales bacterium]
MTPAKYLYVYIGYALLIVLFLGPVLFMLWGSFRHDSDITAFPPRFLGALTFANFQHLFQSLHFGRYLLNSFIVAGGSTLVGLLAGAPGAFCFVRLRLNRLAFVTLIARMAPGVLFLIPLYLMSVKVGAPGNDAVNYIILIFAQVIITLPLAVWLLVPFFEGVPLALDEAAVIDGCSLWQRFSRIALPIVVPGLSVAVTFCFIFSWNYFLFALALANTHTLTLPVIAFNFIGVGQQDWGGLMAAAVLISLPAFALAVGAQRFLVRGLAFGAVK